MITLKTENLSKSIWFWVIVVFGILILGAIIFSLLKSKGVSFVIEGPETVKSGEIVDLHLIYNNSSRVVLQAAEIEIQLPKGVLAVSQPEKEIINFYLGEIKPKSLEEKKLKILVTGEPKTTKTIKAILRYRPKTLTSVFEIPANFDILIIGSIFDLEVKFPSEVFLDQGFPMEINWVNLSNQMYDDIEIRVEWPEGFNLVDSTPKTLSVSENNQWKLGTILPNGSGKIKITGLLYGEAGETKKMKFILGVKRGSDFLPLEKTEGYITLASNPLEITALVNGEKKYNANLGEVLKVEINFKNNYATPLRNLILKTVLDSEIFDFNSLRAPKAFFSLRDKTLIWDGSKVEDLYSLAPGEKGVLNFTIKLKDEWPMVSLAQRNPVIEIKTTLESTNVPEGAPVADLPRAVSVNSIKLHTQCDLSITSFFRDASSGIANQGNLPLRVDEPTDFTIHFKIFNTFNDVKNLKIQTRLPLGVEFTWQIAGNYDNNLPSYNKNSRLFVWEVPLVSSGTGYFNKPLELIFQVRVTPSYSQIYQPVELIEETTLEYTDSFTLKKVQKTYPSVFSDKLTDKTVSPSQGIVQPPY